jgi:hypothetical protein
MIAYSPAAPAIIKCAGGFALSGKKLRMIPSRVLADSISLSLVTPAMVFRSSTFAADMNISGVSDLYDFQFDPSFNTAVLHESRGG